MKTTILVQMHDAKRSQAVAFASVEILVQMHDAKRSQAVAFASVEILVQTYDTVSTLWRL